MAKYYDLNIPGSEVQRRLDLASHNVLAFDGILDVPVTASDELITSAESYQILYAPNGGRGEMLMSIGGTYYRNFRLQSSGKTYLDSSWYNEDGQIRKDRLFLNGEARDIYAYAAGSFGKVERDGITPHIDPTTKHWMIGEVDTGIKAEGEDGTDGTTPHIDPTTKHWMIGETDTGVVAEGVDGKSAFDIWLENGHSGNISDFLAWMKDTSSMIGPKFAATTADCVMVNDTPTLYFVPNGTTFNVYLADSDGQGVSAHSLATGVPGDITNYAGIYDVSQDKAVNGVPPTYGNLSEALGAITDASKKKGGMTIKFIQGTGADTKYVQYRFKKSEFPSTYTFKPGDWESIDLINANIDTELRLIGESIGSPTHIPLTIAHYDKYYEYDNGEINTRTFDDWVCFEPIFVFEYSTLKLKFDCPSNIQKPRVFFVNAEEAIVGDGYSNTSGGYIDVVVPPSAIKLYFGTRLNFLPSYDIIGIKPESVDNRISYLERKIHESSSSAVICEWQHNFVYVTGSTEGTTETEKVIHTRLEITNDTEVTVRCGDEYRIHSVLVFDQAPHFLDKTNKNTQVFSFVTSFPIVINVKRLDGDDIDLENVGDNISITFGSNILNASNIVDNLKDGGNIKVLSAEQGKIIGKALFDDNIFEAGSINYLSGNESDSELTIRTIGYYEIDDEPTATANYDGNSLTVGSRFYDADKQFLSNTYEQNAKYWRCSINVSDYDQEDVIKNIILILNGERVLAQTDTVFADKIYIKGEKEKTVQDCIKEFESEVDNFDKYIDTHLDNPSLDNAPEGIHPDRTLVWSDEFNKPKIDASKWNHRKGTYNSNYIMGDLNKNAYCADSCLHLTNLKDYPLGDSNVSGDNSYKAYSGAFLITSKKFEFRYGLIEAHIKFPDSGDYDHLHSTLWLVGSCFDWLSDDADNRGLRWPACGEIDIAECDDATVNATIHYGDDTDIGGQTHPSVKAVNNYNSRSGWHVYGLEWTPTTLSFYLDGVNKGTVNISDLDATVNNETFNAFKRSMYLILNQNPHNVKTPRQWSGYDKITTLVDYIRIYSPEGVTPVIPTSAELSETDISMQVGETIDLDVTYNGENDINVIDRTCNWKSYNQEVATCHGGRILAKGAGITFVECTHKYGARAICKVTVTAI